MRVFERVAAVPSVSKDIVQEAMLSLLAGDVFRDTPIRSRLSFFKGIYYLNNLMHLKRSFAAWRRRKLMIRDPRSEIAAG